MPGKQSTRRARGQSALLGKEGLEIIFESVHLSKVIFSDDEAGPQTQQAALANSGAIGAQSSENCQDMAID